MNKRYCVVYRTGTQSDFQWQRSLPTGSKEEAKQQQIALVRAGHHAFVEDYGHSMNIGLPETWSRD